MTRLRFKLNLPAYYSQAKTLTNTGRDVAGRKKAKLSNKRIKHQTDWGLYGQYFTITQICSDEFNFNFDTTIVHYDRYPFGQMFIRRNVHFPFSEMSFVYSIKYVHFPFGETTHL